MFKENHTDWCCDNAAFDKGCAQTCIKVRKLPRKLLACVWYIASKYNGNFVLYCLTGNLSVRNNLLKSSVFPLPRVVSPHWLYTAKSNWPQSGYPTLKNKLVVLNTEWLPWLQSRVGHARFLFELETNCTRRQLLWSSYNHYPTDSKHYHLREPPACIKLNMKVPYCNFEVHL